ncbi:MAG TPA: response regulator, partial [Planctomycetota bacterium]|nr:response regulator [Planctomycetota bacterium]
MSALTEGTIRRTAFRITAIYLGVSCLWIVFSDRLVAAIVGGADDVDGLTRLQTAKGIVFVSSTAAILFVLIRRGLRQAAIADERIGQVREAQDARYRELAAHASDQAARSREATQRLEEQLHQSQKMEAIGLLAGGVAHDFNNLLVAMSGYAELALSHVPAGSEASEEIEGIREAVERGAGLTRQLLAFSRRQALEPAPLELNAVLVDLGRMLPRVLGGQVELSIRTEAHPSTVLADLSQMEQVILNLCVNARDAMPDGGRLLLQTESVPARAPDGSRVALVVSDSGTGMDAATRERIFEPFFTTKPIGQGTGLGLSTVYAIVQQTAGSIACASTPGRGTTFRIEFPLVPAELAGGSAPELVTHGTETVLLVEDDACARETSERALVRHGYSVRSAPDMATALDATTAGAAPDILVTAAQLTGGAGDAALRTLLATHPRLAVLVVTSREHALPAAGAPGASMLAMPFTSLELATAVRRALDQRAAPAAPGGQAGDGPDAPVTGESPKLVVLVVDDDSQVCQVVREMLESAGHAVHVAHHGVQALAVLAAVPVDVVLCDMLMPEKEGIETCHEIWRGFPGLPFIAMSGAPGGSNYMRIAVRLGAACSLAKP